MEAREFFELQFEKFRLRVPKGLWYAPYDTWARIEGDEAVVGITDFLQTKTGDIAYVIPEGEAEFEQADMFCSLESFKATIDLTIPVSGTVIAFNSALDQNPEMVNEDPFEAGWIMRVHLSAWEEDQELLLTPEQYFKAMEEKVARELS